MLAAKARTLAIIIGAMKSGTSTLFNMLATHPSICSSRTKESFFFADDRTLGKDDSAYFEQWQPLCGHSVLMEGSTDYTKYPYVRGTPERLKALERKGFVLRFIYIMRHPVERIESHVRHLFLHRCDVTERAAKLAPLECGLLDRVIALSSYAYQLEQYTPHFRRDQLFLATLEQLKADPAGLVNEICCFLDLAPLPSGQIETQPMANVSEEVRIWHYLPGYYRALTDIYLLKRFVSPLMSTGWKARVRRRIARDYAYRTELTAEERTIALERLKPDLRKLDRDWGVPVTEQWRIDL